MSEPLNIPAEVRQALPPGCTIDMVVVCYRVRNPDGSAGSICQYPVTQPSESVRLLAQSIEGVFVREGANNAAKQPKIETPSQELAARLLASRNGGTH